jgi:hypothetical protein
MKRGLTSIIFTYLVAALIMFGCAGGSMKVAVKQDNYTPGFRSSEMSRVKGKTVIMNNFINQAGNTTQWGYYSADKKVFYEAPVHLESYLWYCFQKAFKHAGIKALDQSYGGAYPYHPWGWGVPPPQRAQVPKGVVEFQLVLTSMTDQECKFQILLFKNGEEKFKKDYTVTVAPSSSADTKELEKRSYQLVDQMVTTVFRDSEFRKVF